MTEFLQKLNGLIQGKVQFSQLIDPNDEHERILLDTIGNRGNLALSKDKNLVEVLKKWINKISAPLSVNACFHDTTILYTVKSLFIDDRRSYYVTPQTLFDLSTIVNSVILYDKIIFLENPYFDAYWFNEKLGNDPIFITLPVKGFIDEQGDLAESAMSQLFDAFWKASCGNMKNLRNADISTDMGNEKNEIIKSWRYLLNRDLTESEVFHDEYDSNWSSTPSQLLDSLISYQDRDFNIQIATEEGAMLHEGYLMDCNTRCLFNNNLSFALDLPYVPTVSRFPFHSVHYKRSRIIHSNLATVSQLNDVYKRYSSAYVSPSDCSIQLPFFLSVVLNKCDTLEDFFKVLSEIRSQTDSIRVKRKELEQAIADGNGNEIRKIHNAFLKETDTIKEKFQGFAIQAMLTGLISLLSTKDPSYVILFVSLIINNNNPWIDRLINRYLRPTEQVLSDLSVVAFEITNQFPKIHKLWNLPDEKNNKYFKEGLDSISKIGFC